MLDVVCLMLKPCTAIQVKHRAFYRMDEKSDDEDETKADDEDDESKGKGEGDESKGKDEGDETKDKREGNETNDNDKGEETKGKDTGEKSGCCSNSSSNNSSTKIADSGKYPAGSGAPELYSYFFSRAQFLCTELGEPYCREEQHSETKEEGFTLFAN